MWRLTWNGYSQNKRMQQNYTKRATGTDMSGWERWSTGIVLEIWFWLHLCTNQNPSFMRKHINFSGILRYKRIIYFARNSGLVVINKKNRIQWMEFADSADHIVENKRKRKHSWILRFDKPFKGRRTLEWHWYKEKLMGLEWLQMARKNTVRIGNRGRPSWPLHF